LDENFFNSAPFFIVFLSRDFPLMQKVDRVMELLSVASMEDCRVSDVVSDV